MAQQRRTGRKSPAKYEKKRQEQEVKYIPPAPVNRGQIALMVASVIAVAVAIFLGLSVFFRVDAKEFRVQGNRMYSANTIWEASKIVDGDSLIGFGKAQAASSIMQQLPYIKTVRIQITLPDTVTIYVEELTVCLAAQDVDGGWWLLSTEGKVLEKTVDSVAKKWTILEGVTLQSPVAGQIAIAALATTDANASMQTDAQRLQAALNVALALEDEEILGSIRSIDAANLTDLTFWYQDRLLVKLGDQQQLADKIVLINSTIHTQLGQRDAGILHVSSANGIQIEFERRKFE